MRGTSIERIRERSMVVAGATDLSTKVKQDAGGMSTLATSVDYRSAPGGLMIRRFALTTALAVGLAACTPTATPSPAGQTLTGTFALNAPAGTVFAPTCAGDGGYADIAAGMGVTLRDGEGNVLGASRLGTGHASGDRRQCVFEFSFDDVADAEFYVLEAGRRGEQTYSRADLEEQGWTVGFTLGP